MRFTLRQIQVFVEASADGNFRRTAERLGISQPAVSRHIQLLERSAGGRLFERARGSSARLSTLGQEVLAEARQLLHTAGKVRRGTTDPRQGQLLRVAVGPYLQDQWLRPLVRSLYAMDGTPDIRLIELEGPEQVIGHLQDGDAEIGFYTGRPARSPDLVSEAVSVAAVGLYGRPSLVRRLGTDPQRIAAAPLIMPLAGSRAARWQAAELARAGLEPTNIVCRSQFHDVVLDLLLKGVGIGMLFDGHVARHVRSGRLARVPVDFEPGQRCYAARAEVARDPRARRVLSFLRESLKQFQS